MNNQESVITNHLTSDTLPTFRTQYRLIASILVFGLFVSTASAQRVETVKFESKLVNAPLIYNVALPKDYDTARATRYPVLYLLHGLTGHYSDWAARTNVAD